MQSAAVGNQMLPHLLLNVQRRKTGPCGPFGETDVRPAPWAFQMSEVSLSVI